MMADDKPTFTAEDLAVLGSDATNDKVDPAATDGDAGGDPDAADKTGAGGDDAAGDKAGGDKGAKKDGAADDYLPADWREKEVARLGLTGDALDKALKRAKAAATPAELLRSQLSADSKIGELTALAKGMVKVPTGKGDKPEDVAAYRKAAGVPDKADGYKIPDPPKELGDRSDLDKTIISEALKEFHGANFSQSQVAAAIAAFDAAQIEMTKVVEQQLTKVNDDAEEDLRATFGREFKANVELANRWLKSELGAFMAKDELVAFLNEQEAGKPRRGNNPGFVKWAVKQARLAADDGDFPASEDTSATDPQKRHDEILALSHSSKTADQEQYKKLQPELIKLVTQLNKRKK